MSEQLNRYINSAQFTKEELEKIKNFLERLVDLRKTKRSRGLTLSLTPTESRYFEKLSKQFKLSKTEVLRRLIFSVHPSYIPFLLNLYKEQVRLNDAIVRVLDTQDAAGLTEVLQSIQEAQLKILEQLERRK